MKGGGVKWENFPFVKSPLALWDFTKTKGRPFFWGPRWQRANSACETEAPMTVTANPQQTDTTSYEDWNEVIAACCWQAGLGVQRRSRKVIAFCAVITTEFPNSTLEVDLALVSAGAVMRGTSASGEMMWLDLPKPPSFDFICLRVTMEQRLRRKTKFSKRSLHYLGLLGWPIHITSRNYILGKRWKQCKL